MSYNISHYFVQDNLNKNMGECNLFSHQLTDEERALVTM